METAFLGEFYDFTRFMMKITIIGAEIASLSEKITSLIEIFTSL